MMRLSTISKFPSSPKRKRGIIQITPFDVVVPPEYDARMAEQVIQDTTGHRSSDGVKAYKCASFLLKIKANGILQGNLPQPQADAKSNNMAIN